MVENALRPSKMQKTLHFPQFSLRLGAETTRQTCQKRYNSYPKHAHIRVWARTRSILYHVLRCSTYWTSERQWKLLAWREEQENH